MAIVRGGPNTDIEPGGPDILPPFEFNQGVERTVTNRRVGIYLGSRRFYFGIENVHYRFSTGPVHGRRDRDEPSGNWRWMGYAGSGLLMFCLIFASANMLRASAPAGQYSAVIAIPEKAAVTAPRHKAHGRRFAAVRPAGPRLPSAATSDVTAALSPATDISDLDLTAGQASAGTDIQDLPAGTGERALAVYGPRRQIGNKSCRDASVFVRGTDGKVSMAPVVRCDP